MLGHERIGSNSSIAPSSTPPARYTLPAPAHIISDVELLRATDGDGLFFRDLDASDDDDQVDHHVECRSVVDKEQGEEKGEEGEETRLAEDIEVERPRRHSFVAPPNTDFRHLEGLTWTQGTPRRSNDHGDIECDIECDIEPFALDFGPNPGKGIELVSPNSSLLVSRILGQDRRDTLPDTSTAVHSAAQTDFEVDGESSHRSASNSEGHIKVSPTGDTGDTTNRHPHLGIHKVICSNAVQEKLLRRMNGHLDKLVHARQRYSRDCAGPKAETSRKALEAKMDKCIQQASEALIVLRHRPSSSNAWHHRGGFLLDLPLSYFIANSMIFDRNVRDAQADRRRETVKLEAEVWSNLARALDLAHNNGQLYDNDVVGELFRVREWRWGLGAASVNPKHALSSLVAL